MAYTNGFLDTYLRDEHFDDHHLDFEVSTPHEYEEQADLFLGGPKPATTQECRRLSNGDLIRYNTVTQEFGVLSADNYIRTYYKPKPHKHRQPTNLKYFHAECLK